MKFHGNAPAFAPASAQRQSGASSIHQTSKVQYKTYCGKLRLDAAALAGDASKTFSEQMLKSTYLPPLISSAALRG